MKTFQKETWIKGTVSWVLKSMYMKIRRRLYIRVVQKPAIPTVMVLWYIVCVFLSPTFYIFVIWKINFHTAFKVLRSEPERFCLAPYRGYNTFHLIFSFKVRSSLKGQLHEIFDPRFFHKSTPPRALIHGLKPFCIWPNIRRKNRQYSIFSGVNDPAETVLTGSLTPLTLPEFFLQILTIFYGWNFTVFFLIKNILWNVILLKQYLL
jgi:hypothetical protein